MCFWMKKLHRRASCLKRKPFQLLIASPTIQQSAYFMFDNLVLARVPCKTMMTTKRIIACGSGLWLPNVLPVSSGQTHDLGKLRPVPKWGSSEIMKSKPCLETRFTNKYKTKQSTGRRFTWTKMKQNSSQQSQNKNETACWQHLLGIPKPSAEQD